MASYSYEPKYLAKHSLRERCFFYDNVYKSIFQIIALINSIFFLFLGRSDSTFSSFASEKLEVGGILALSFFLFTVLN